MMLRQRTLRGDRVRWAGLWCPRLETPRLRLERSRLACPLIGN
jgi:hypothetical protein